MGWVGGRPCPPSPPNVFACRPIFATRLSQRTVSIVSSSPQNTLAGTIDGKIGTDLCCGPQGSGRLGRRQVPPGRRLREHPHCHARRARPARPVRCPYLVQREQARVCISRRRKGRWNPRQLDPARRVHLRQPDDPRHRCPCRLPERRQEAPLPWKLLHLPSECPQPMREEHLLDGRSSRQTSPMRSQRLPASSSARPIASSTAATSSRRCRPTSTAPGTTSI